MLGAFGWSELLDAMVAAGTLALAFVAWRTLQFAARASAEVRPFVVSRQRQRT
jgi:hypothetical protein